MGTVLKAGGRIPAEERYLYVPREADEKVYARLREGKFCAILAPRQVGKTSLQHHVAKRLETEDGIRCLFVTFEQLSPAPPLRKGLFQSLLISLSGDTDEIDIPADDFWDDGKPYWLQFCKYIEEKLLLDSERSIVIFIDEIQMILSFEDSSNGESEAARDVFGDLLKVVKYFEEKPAADTARFLTFCMAGTATPEELLPSGTNPRKHTAIYGAAFVKLDDFRLEKEAVRFIPALQEFDEQPELLLYEIYRWTDGHPYMTQRLCCEIKERRPPLLRSTAERVALVAQIVHSVFSSIASDPVLNDSQARIAVPCANPVAADKLRDRLLTEYQSILTTPKRVRAQSELHVRLRIAGLIKEQADDRRRLNVRNQIFASLFSADWIALFRHSKLTWAGRAADWAKTKDPALLLKKADLEQATQLVNPETKLDDAVAEPSILTETPLGAAETEFVLASLAHDRKSFWSRTRYYIGAVIIGGLILGNIAGIYAKDWYDRDEAARQAQAARQSDVALARFLGQHAGQETLGLAKGLIRVEEIRESLQPSEGTTKRWLRRVVFAQRPGSWSFQGLYTLWRFLFPADSYLPQPAELESAVEALSSSLMSVQYSLVLRDGDVGGAVASSVAKKDREACGGLEVQSVALSDDGRWAVTAHRDCGVRLWELSAYRARLRSTYRGHRRVVNAVSFVKAPAETADAAAYVLTGSEDGTAHLLSFALRAEPTTPTPPTTPAPPRLPTEGVAAALALPLSLSATPTAVYAGLLAPLAPLASEAPDASEASEPQEPPPDLLQQVQVLSPFDDERPISNGRVVPPRSSPLWSISASPDGSYLATATRDGRVTLWRRQGRRGELRYVQDSERCPRWVEEATAGAINSVAFNQTGDQLLTAGYRGARLYAVHPFCPERTVLSGRSVEHGLFVQDERLALLASENRIGLISLAPESAAVEPSWLGYATGRRIRYTSAAFLPGERQRFVSTDDAGGVKLWSRSLSRPEATELLSQFYGHTAAVNAVAISPDGSRMMTASDDETARLWRLPSRRELTFAALDPQRKQVLVVERSGQVLAGALPAGGRDPELLPVQLSDDKTATLPLRTETEEESAAPQPVELRQLELAESGSLGLVLDQKHNMLLFDLPSGKLSGRVTGDAALPISSAVLSPKGDRIAAVQEVPSTESPPGFFVRLYENRGQGWTNDLSLRHPDFVNAVAFDRDGQRILTGSRDHLGRVWNVSGGGEPIALKKHSHWVTCGAFSPSGEQVATGGRDRAVYLWTVPKAGAVPAPVLVHSHEHTVTRVAFSADGLLLASATQGGSVHVSRLGSAYDRDTLKIAALPDAVESIAFSRDGKQLLAIGQSGTAYLWDLELPLLPDPVPAVSPPPPSSVDGAAPTTPPPPRPQARLVASLSAGLRGRQSAVLTAALVGNELVTVHQDGLISRFPTTLEGYVDRACCLLESVGGNPAAEFSQAQSLCKKRAARHPVAIDCN